MTEKTDSTKWFALIVVIVGTFMAALDSSIVNVALPRMMTVFGTDYTTAKWIITAYALATGAVIPITGYLTNVFGSKRVYIFALSVFTIGSMLCGFAGSISQMIAFRALQAVGGGMIMPVGMAMILQLFKPEERGSAMGVWGMASMAAPMLGPTLGGAIVEYLDWHMIFYLNLPVGVVGVALAIILLKGSGKIQPRKIDIVGFVTATIGMVCLLYMFGEWANIDWTNMIYPILLILGIGSMLLFILNELFHPEPLLDLRMFKLVSFTQSQIVTLILMLGMMGGTFVLPLFFQDIQGMTPMQSGMMMMPSAITASVMMAISGKIYAKLGLKKIMIPGLTLLFITSVLMALSINVNTPKSHLIMLTVIRAVAMGLTMMPVATYGLKEISGADGGKASALASTVRQIVAAFSVTLMAVLINHFNTANYAYMAQQVSPFNPYIYGLFEKMQGLYMSMGMTLDQARGSAAQLFGGLVAQSAYVNSMSQATGIMAMATVVAIAFTFFMTEKSTQAPVTLPHD